MLQELRIGTSLAALVIAVAALAVALTNDGSDGGGPSTVRAADTTSGHASVTVAPFQEKGHSVVIENFAYSPEPVGARVGEAVVWINRDEAPHTVTAQDGSWSSGTLVQGDGVAMIFSEPGTYEYICALHPPATTRVAGAAEGVKLAGGGGGHGMKGTIIVEE